MSDPVIRRYRPSDRAAVRQICLDTADGGHPLDVDFFSDTELFADLLTGYFTDLDSELLFIADADGEVVGYLSGCLNTTVMHRDTSRKIVPASLWRALWRGTLLRWSMLRTLWSNTRVWVDSLWQRQRHAGHYPAQLHINLKPGFRGRHVGRTLVETFLSHLRQRQIHGVEAAVREDNLLGRRFFESLGFVALAQAPLLVRKGRTLCSVIYGKSLV